VGNLLVFTDSKTFHAELKGRDLRTPAAGFEVIYYSEGLSGTVTAVNSTLIGNSAEGGDGGGDGSNVTVGQDGQGLGNALFVFGGSHSLNHVTLGSNQRLGANNTSSIAVVVYNQNNDFDKDNGPALDSVADAQLNISNSILADPASCDVSSNFRFAPISIVEPFNLANNNLYTDTDCGSNDVASITGLASDLADNGGPTQTLAISADSNALDQVSTNTPATDQRGVNRPSGSAADIGAFELDQSQPDSEFYIVPLSNGNAVIIEL
ncbi:MAG: hypothetical protein KTR35_18495, partial [Gammaproteobacteria bacterium]|nr:hypothetical protein [Gammaproteobacteria bacterium]